MAPAAAVAAAGRRPDRTRLRCPSGSRRRRDGARPDRQRYRQQSNRVRRSHRPGGRSGAVGMGMATAKTVEGIARQPEAEGKIRTSLMLGLVFIETAIIYALLVVILLIFVL